MSTISITKVNFPTHHFITNIDVTLSDLIEYLFLLFALLVQCRVEYMFVFEQIRLHEEHDPLFRMSVTVLLTLARRESLLPVFP